MQCDIHVDDYVFLRPTQSEALIPQFDQLYVYVEGKFLQWQTFREYDYILKMKNEPKPLTIRGTDLAVNLIFIGKRFNHAAKPCKIRIDFIYPPFLSFEAVPRS